MRNINCHESHLSLSWLILKHCALFKVSNCNMTTVIVEVVAFGVTGGK